MPTMTRQHFQLIADVLKTNKQSAADTLGGGSSHHELIVREFAEALARTNPNFKRDRVLKACGIE